MTIDLSALRGQTAEQVIKTLLADGYQAVAAESSREQFFRDAKATHLVRLSTTPSLSTAFSKACQASDNNCFLPKVLDHATLDSGVHVSITENLQRLDEIGGDALITLFGHARAVSSFFAGDEMHAPVHKCMTYDPQLLAAAQAVLGVAMDEPKTSRTAINPAGNSIWFRKNDQGCQTVYADPFMHAADKTADACRADLEWIEKRLSENERNASYSIYWRDTHPAAPKLA